jgi:hypothetical protein
VTFAPSHNEIADSRNQNRLNNEMSEDRTVFGSDAAAECFGWGLEGFSRRFFLVGYQIGATCSSFQPSQISFKD